MAIHSAEISARNRDRPPPTATTRPAKKSHQKTPSITESAKL